jgi:two-component system chemotaxis response regulator CheY
MMVATADPAFDRTELVSSRRVMIVDDDPDIRESLMEFLEDHGFETIGARDGLEALQTLGTTDRPPCLIILDLMMPNMDGRTFREKQLEQGALAGIPVVVISAYRDAAHSHREMQAAAWIPKPLNLTTLLRVIRERCADA